MQPTNTIYSGAGPGADDAETVPMNELLSFTVIVEPDRQRLARFALDAVRTLGGNSFRATAALMDILTQLHADCMKSAGHILTRLVLEDATLCLEWHKTRRPFETLPCMPADESIEALSAHLRQASESADPELLIRRNQRIRADLEQAHKQAAEEMAELEQVLDRKKQELRESIRIAETDSLTGLLNRGAFDTRLREMFLRRQRQGEPLCLMMLDIDNFKQVNDSQGHQQGDEHLKHVANAMRAGVREHVDYSCRIGGDEFAIIASTNTANTWRIAENILTRTDHRISIGIAAMQGDDTVDALIGRADAALYKAKHNGRGCIALSDEPLVKVIPGTGKATRSA